MVKKVMVKLIISILFMYCSVACATGERAIDILNKYTQNLSKLRKSVVIKLEQHARYGIGESAYERRVPCEIRLDGERAFGCYNYDYEKLDKPHSLLDETEARKFHLWDGERFIEYHDSLSNPRAYLKRDNEIRGFEVSVFPGSPLLGIRNHSAYRIDEDLSQLGELTLSEDLETIGSIECHVITARNEFCDYSIWISPKQGYNIIQADIVHKAGSQGEYGTIPPNETRNYKLRDVKVQLIEGVHVPVESKVTFEKYKKGELVRKYEIKEKVNEVNINPDHGTYASFVPKMRNGTRVVDTDHDFLYIWQNGKLKPNIDPTVVDTLDTIIVDLGVDSNYMEEMPQLDMPTPDANGVNKADRFDTSRSDMDKASPKLYAMRFVGSILILVIIIIGIITWRVLHRKDK